VVSGPGCRLDISGRLDVLGAAGLTLQISVRTLVIGSAEQGVRRRQVTQRFGVFRALRACEPPPLLR
jgi:hypothetical protein